MTAALVIEHENGYFESILCHFDYGPASVIWLLTNYYNKEDKIKKLMEFGTINYLNKDLNIISDDCEEIEDIVNSSLGKTLLDSIRQLEATPKYIYLFKNNTWHISIEDCLIPIANKPIVRYS